MKKAVAYIRVSSTRQAKEGFSLENQEERIKHYCQYKGLEIVEFCQDKGISGYKNVKRPGYDRVMQLVKSKEVEAVVVYSLSRFARKVKWILSAIEVMEENNVSFHSVSDSIDTGSAIGKLTLNVLSSVAQFESDIISERTSDVLAMKKESKRTYSNVAPYGYVNQDGVLVESESEQPVLKIIKKLKAEGKSHGDIAALLNGQHAPTKKGGLWHRSTVKAILDNTIHK